MIAPTISKRKPRHGRATRRFPPIIADQFKDVADPDPVDIAAAYQAAVSALPYVESWKAKPDHEFSGFSAKKYSDPSSWETLRTGYNKGRARFGLPPISQEDFERIWTPLAEWGSSDIRPTGRNSKRVGTSGQKGRHKKVSRRCPVNDPNNRRHDTCKRRVRSRVGPGL